MRKILTLFAIVSLSFTTAGKDIWFHDNFEEENNMRFFYCSDPFVRQRNMAEKEGYMTVHREGITVLEENRSHSEVRSWALDLTVNKNTGRWGAVNRWASKKKLDIPLNKPVWLTAFVYPEQLPPELSIRIGVSFNCVKDGKPIRGGFRSFSHKGVDAQGWMVFQENITEFLTKNGYLEATMTCWGVEVVSAHQQPFKGQRVKFFLDDVTVASEPEKVELNTAGQVRYMNIEPGPHTVGYASLYANYPEEEPNRVRNSSFENGLDCWYPSVVLAGTDAASLFLPNPAESFRIRQDKAPHGNKFLEFYRHDGQATRCSLSSMPIGIKDGKPYTLTFYAKSSKADEILTCNFVKFPLTTEWKRYRHHFPEIRCSEKGKKKFPARFELHFNHTGNANIMLDAIQLEEGNGSEFHHPELTTLSIRPENHLGIWKNGEDPAVGITLFNGTSKTAKGKLIVKVQDFAHQEIKRWSEKIELKTGEGSKLIRPLPKGWRHYKVTAALEMAGQKQQQAITAVSVVDDLTKLEGRDFFGQLGFASPNPDNLRDALELNQLLGVHNLLIYHLFGMRWYNDWRTNEGIWNRMDFILDQVLEHGFVPFPALANFDAPGFKKDTAGLHYFEPEEVKEIGEWCFKIAQRFRSKVNQFEVFTEYMIGNPEPRAKNIMKVLPTVYRELKRGNPECTVVTWGQHGMNTVSKMLETHFRLGSLEYSDAISLHPYRLGTDNQELLRQIYPAINTLVHKYNHDKTKPIWATEAGHRAVDTLHYDDIEPESMYYPLHCTELEQAERTVRENIIALAAGVKRYFSFYTNAGARFFSFSYVQRENGIRPKTVFPAYNFMVSQLAGAEFIKVIERPENKYLCYLFRRAKDTLAVLWHYDDDHSPKSVDFELAPSKLTAFNLVGESLELTPGKQLQLPVGSSPIYLRSTDVETFITAMERPTMDSISLKAMISGPNRVEFTLVNGNLPREGLISLTGKSLEKLTLQAGETRRVSVPIGNKQEVQAIWKDAACVQQTSLGFLPVASANSKAETIRLAPQFRTSRFPELKYGGETDLSAQLRAKADQINFYLEVDVRDDIHAGEYSLSNQPHFIWANDALQLAFDHPDFPEFKEVNVSLTSEGPLTFVTMGYVNTEQFRIEITRSDDMTHYRITIPWLALWPKFQWEETPKIRFNLAVVDNDGPPTVPTVNKFIGDKQALQLTPGITDGKNSQKFRLLRFL